VLTVKNLYHALLIDHYKHPRNCFVLPDADFTSKEYNPSCGDMVHIFGCVDNNSTIYAITFQGSGCVISQASVSLLTEKVKNMKLSLVLELDKDFMEGIIGVSLGPVRLRCALLGLVALQKGLLHIKSR